MLCGLSDVQQTKEVGLADLALCRNVLSWKPRNNSERENQSQEKQICCKCFGYNTPKKWSFLENVLKNIELQYIPTIIILH